MNTQFSTSLVAQAAPVATVTPKPLAATPATVAAPAEALQIKASTVNAPKVQARKEVQLTVNPEVEQRKLDETIKKLNEEMRRNGMNLNFAVDKSLTRPMVVVRHSETGEVIRQIPNEAAVRMAHKIEELKGLLFNKRA